MKFSSTFARLLWRGGFAAGVTALALAACGGGTDIEDFRPNRILAFGDEASVLLAASAAGGNTPAASAAPLADLPASTSGLKYGVNAVQVIPAASNASGVVTPAREEVDCRVYPIWVQSVAAAFGLTFQECRGTTAEADARGRILAQAGAFAAAPANAASSVSDIRRQIDTFLAGGSFTDQDIVTVMAGQNDIVDAFLNRGTATDEALVESMRQRGKQLAEQVNRIAVSGPAVIVMRIPNVGYTPWGRAQGEAGAQLLRRMTEGFNTSLQLNLINDGHLIGLAFGDSELRNMVDFPDAYSLVNVTQPVCQQAADRPPAAGQRPTDTPLLTACGTYSTVLTSVGSGASAASAPAVPSTYLWAGNLTMGPTAQSRLGSLAADRALNNPF